jgi:hypothetical protein
MGKDEKKRINQWLNENPADWNCWVSPLEIISASGGTQPNLQKFGLFV